MPKVPMVGGHMELSENPEMCQVSSPILCPIKGRQVVAVSVATSPVGISHAEKISGKENLKVSARKRGVLGGRTDKIKGHDISVVMLICEPATFENSH